LKVSIFAIHPTQPSQRLLMHILFIFSIIMKEKLYVLACDFGVEHIGTDKELAQEGYNLLTKKQRFQRDCALFEIDVKKIR